MNADAKVLVTAIAAALLSACGGGGGAPGEQAVAAAPGGKANVFGVAAVGAPIRGATVLLQCLSGRSEVRTVTDSEGRWSADVRGDGFPCSVAVVGGDLPLGQCHYSAAMSPGIVNVTPITSLWARTLGGVGGHCWGENSTLGIVTPQSLTTARVQTDIAFLKSRLSLLPGLEGMAQVDPITTPFSATPADPVDRLLEGFGDIAIESGQFQYWFTETTYFPDDVWVAHVESERRGELAAWNKAVVYLPFTSSPTTMSAIALHGTAPVAIGFHGCKGLGTLPEAWGPVLSNLGYLVIFPDSLAREDREGRFTCETTSKSVGGNDDIYYKRVGEVHASIRQARKSPWWNGKQLLVFGHSEGGWAVDLKPVHGATAKIVSGYWCSGADNTVPTLTVNYQQDPWYFGKLGLDGKPLYLHNCPRGQSLAPTTNFFLDGAFHNAFETEAGKKAVTDFAAAHLVSR